MKESHSNLSEREEEVVLKVTEFMETLDQIKRYNTLARSMKMSSLIITASIGIALAIVLLFGYLDTLMKPLLPWVLFIPLTIAWGGITVSVIYMERKINSVRLGEWKEELSHGFPSALKLLTEIDWERMLGEISLGRFSYALYGFMKTSAYWIVTTIAFEISWRVYTVYFPQSTTIWDILIWAVVALALVLLLLSRDLSKRRTELRELDVLLSELRWFSLEIGRAKF